MAAVPSCFFRRTSRFNTRCSRLYACWCPVRAKVHGRLAAFIKTLQCSATANTRAYTFPLLSASTCLTHTDVRSPRHAPFKSFGGAKQDVKHNTKNAPEMSCQPRAAGAASAPAKAAGCRLLPGLILRHRRCR